MTGGSEFFFGGGSSDFFFLGGETNKQTSGKMSGQNFAKRTDCLFICFRNCKGRDIFELNGFVLPASFKTVLSLCSQSGRVKSLSHFQLKVLPQVHERVGLCVTFFFMHLYNIFNL